MVACGQAFCKCRRKGGEKKRKSSRAECERERREEERGVGLEGSEPAAPTLPLNYRILRLKVASEVVGKK